MTPLDWYGHSAWRLNNTWVQIVIVPALGAKIASLVDTTAGYEWLAAPTRPIRKREYGDTFVDHDLSGWDEMFPTIDACPSPHDPAVMLPDHGEVWALSWETVARSEEAITLQVSGRALDYLLTRTVTLLPNGLRLDYAVENRTGKALPYLWAAHPLFRGNDTEVVLPAEVKQVVAVAHPRIETANTLLDWALATLPDGERQRLDQVGEPSRKDFRKVYLQPDQRIASAGLRQHGKGCTLNMSWDATAAPYLGVWVDEGTYTKDSTVALEPCSGYYDSVERAIAQGRVTTIPANGRASWWVEVRLGAA